MEPLLGDAKKVSLQNLLDKALLKADELLDDADEMSASDRAKAIATAQSIHDYAVREQVRAHARQACLEAARVLSGAYEGMDNVQLGSWAEGSEDDVFTRAQEVLSSSKHVYL